MCLSIFVAHKLFQPLHLSTLLLIKGEKNVGLAGIGPVLGYHFLFPCFSAPSHNPALTTKLSNISDR